MISDRQHLIRTCAASFIIGIGYGFVQMTVLALAPDPDPYLSWQTSTWRGTLGAGAILGWFATFLSERWLGRTGQVLLIPNSFSVFSAALTILAIQYWGSFRVSDGEIFSLLLGGAGFVVATFVRAEWDTLESG